MTIVAKEGSVQDGRKEEIEIDTSTLADRVGACVVALDPIVQALKVHVLAAEHIHTDDTTLRCWLK